MKNPCIDCKSYYPFCSCDRFLEYYNNLMKQKGLIDLCVYNIN